MTPGDPDASTVTVTVEFEDVDAYRIVHHSRFVLFLERARVRYFAASGLKLEPQRVHPVLHHLEMRYLKPARLLDELAVSVYLRTAEEYRLVLGYQIRRGDELVARATTALAFVDSVSGELAPVPDEWRRALLRPPS